MKNLYNFANYIYRQAFILPRRKTLSEAEALFLTNLNTVIANYNNFRSSRDGEFKPMGHIGSGQPTIISYGFLDYLFKHLESMPFYNTEYPKPYRELPSHTAQQCLKLLCRDWKSFFQSIKDYSKHPAKYKSRPKPPKYAPKDGRKTAIFTNQMCSLSEDNVLRFGKINLDLVLTADSFSYQGKLQLLRSDLQEVRITPTSGCYKVEIIYNKEVTETKEPSRIIAIDLGIDNFATIVNNLGLKPIVIKGKAIKSINQFYNKKKADLQGKLPEKVFNSKRISRLTKYRNNYMENFMHLTAKRVIDYCVANEVDTIVVGYTQNWKQEINIGSVNNQKFTNIPYLSFVRKLQYKAEDAGINVIIREESFTSKASFLDRDGIPNYTKDHEKYTFSGTRIKRGLYKSSSGKLVNADVNGAYNIFRKGLPELEETIYDSLQPWSLHPERLNVFCGISR